MAELLDWPTLADVERDTILRTLSLMEGNRTRTAKILGISIRGLRGKLHDYAAQGHVVEPAHSMETFSRVGEGPP